MDPDPRGGDTDPLDYSKNIDTMLKRRGGISNDFIEVWRNIIFLYPDPQGIQTPAPEYQTIIKYILCTVGLVGKQPWLCSRVVILFLCSY